MCCFSQTVESVSATKIFARVAGVYQFLVYEMQLSTKTDVAMVLPLPVEPNGDRQGDLDQTRKPTVEFINLEHYAEFFVDMNLCFPQPRSFNQTKDIPSAGVNTKLLQVFSIGSFDASFVPTVKDFERLDPCFRLPDNVWQKLPRYHNYSFAVFKLKQGKQKIHPIALKFITRHDSLAFFPTVHIHNGEVEEVAEFDHTLYLQSASQPNNNWQKAIAPPHKKMDLNNSLKGDRTKGIVSQSESLYRQRLSGFQINQDTFIHI